MFVHSCLCFIVSEVLFDIDFVALEVLLERELLRSERFRVIIL